MRTLDEDLLKRSRITDKGRRLAGSVADGDRLGINGRWHGTDRIANHRPDEADDLVGLWIGFDYWRDEWLCTNSGIGFSGGHPLSPGSLLETASVTQIEQIAGNHSDPEFRIGKFSFWMGLPSCLKHGLLEVSAPQTELDKRSASGAFCCWLQIK